MGTITGANNWLEGMMGQGLGQSSGVASTGFPTGSQWYSVTGPAESTANYDLPYTASAVMGMTNPTTGLGQNMSSYQSSLPQTQQNFGSYSNAETQGAQSGLNNIGGYSNDMYQGVGGNLSPGISTSGTVSNNLIGNQGATNYNQYMQGAAMNAAAGGGMTPTLSALMNPITSIMGNQGNTAQSNSLYNASTPLLQSNGQTALTQGLANQGMNLFNQQALMNPAQAAGLARNQAATNYAQQAQQQEQQALARGGGAGSVVANGLQNQGMADFANQAAQGISAAGTTALQNQQQLQLQQQLGGATAAASGGNLQNSLLGTSGGLANNSGTMADNYMLQSMGLLPTTQNAASNYLGQYLGAGANGASNQVSMLGAGTNLQNNLMGYSGTMGNLADTTTNNAYSQALASGALGNTQFQTLTGAENAGYGQQNQYMSNLNNLYSNQINPLVTLGGQQGNMQQTGLTSMASILNGGMGAAGATGSQFLNNILGIAGTAAAAA